MKVVQSEDIYHELINNPGIQNSELYLKFPSVKPGTIRYWKHQFIKKN